MPPLPIERSPALPRGFAVGAPLYLRPTHILSGPEADSALARGSARRLAGGPLAFNAVEVLARERDRVVTAAAEPAELESWCAVADWAQAERCRTLLGRLTEPRPPVAGLSMDRPAVMGIVNVTPDSFSDGGDNLEQGAAVAHGRALAEAGAAIVDVGGESTRPRAEPIDAATEQARILPVIEALAEAGITVSVDTRRAETMRAASDVGAALINDVSALTYDPQSVGAAAASGRPVVLMHALGDPRTMQDAPDYAHASLDIFDYLESRIRACEAGGVPRDRIIVDPGVGFGKTLEHNLQILHDVAIFHGLGCPVLLGASRKSFIGRLSREEPPKARLPGSLATALWGVSQGVQIVRVHDVAETVQAIRVWEALAARRQLR